MGKCVVAEAGSAAGGISWPAAGYQDQQHACQLQVHQLQNSPWGLAVAGVRRDAGGRRRAPPLWRGAAAEALQAP